MLNPSTGKKKDSSYTETGEEMNYFVSGYVYTAEEAKEAEQKKQLVKQNSLVKKLSDIKMQNC